MTKPWGDTEVNKADIVPAWETNRKMNRRLFIILCNTCRRRQGSHAQGTREEKFPSAERSEKTIKKTIFLFLISADLSYVTWFPLHGGYLQSVVIYQPENASCKALRIDPMWPDGTWGN